MAISLNEDSSYDWRKGGIIYQVYPRSFRAAKGGETGDLKGITEKLPYIQSLGVDAIWISPFFKSPMKDFGYDVSDYCDVDPLFGTLKDFDALLVRAHRLGLKIIIDMILCHTSDQHAWFKESAADRHGDKADFYVWADAKPDGSPPNNWQSVFRGPSWTFHAGRGQYYFHNFLPSQPHVNLHHPAARNAVIGAMKFWLDRGVDGVRLDAAAHYFYNPSLRDNPPSITPRRKDTVLAAPMPYTMQRHINDTSEKHSLAFMEHLRVILDQYPGRIAIGELGGQDGLRLSALYTKGKKRLHTAYNFSLISTPEPSARSIREALEGFSVHGRQSWPSWAFSNHDTYRIASRWHDRSRGFSHNPALSRCINAALLSLRGTIFLYQGEELGLPEATLTYDQIRDPVGLANYPYPGRDGCRTPMPWERRKAHAGFTSGPSTWLPVPQSHRELAVDTQEKDKTSTLNFTRAFIAWRRAHTAMIGGEITFLETGDDRHLTLIRHDKKQRVLCSFNFADKPVIWPMPETMTFAETFESEASGTIRGGKLRLPPYGIFSGVF